MVYSTPASCVDPQIIFHLLFQLLDDNRTRHLAHSENVKVDVKKSVDANLEFLLTVFRGHVLACACKILEIHTLDGIQYTCLLR